MLKQITRLSVHQTSKVWTAIHFFLSLIFFIPFSIYNYIQTKDAATFILLGLPFVMAIFIYILSAFYCWFYNLIASAFGGIEVNLEDPRDL